MKTAEEKKQYMKDWHLANKKKEKDYVKINKDKINRQKKEWAKANPAKTTESVKKWNKANPIKLKEQHNKSINKRKVFDELFRLKCRVRSTISKTIRRFNIIKKNKTSDILGCSFEEFKQHLESKFESWMNWDNYGKYNGNEGYGWDIDHIEPLSLAKTEVCVLQLCHYSNLQPLCSKFNRDIKKGLKTQKIMIELSMDF